MDSELVNALDRLRASVDALRTVIETAVDPRAHRPHELYLEDLRDLRDKGLIDERVYAEKRAGYLDKV
jgi:hypothetical protein